MSRLEKILLAINLLLYGFITIFSYSYVDLNLTLSQNRLILIFVKTMQQLGYFHRPQATLIYLLLIIFTFSFFILNLVLFYKSKIGFKYLKISTIVNTVILIFAYPFLSSDLFNYLFDAKIILTYQASPYTHRPLDFPHDEWLRFMRWIHRYSPYGPLWLVMSLLPAALGFGKFILSFLSFKIFIALFHLINSYLIYKTLEKINHKQAIFGTAFYALNPLFLIEGVANAHNDVVLATFLILPIYLLAFKKGIISSYVALVAGTLIKYIPILNLPWLILFQFFSKTRSVKRVIVLNLLAMAVFTYLFSSFKISVPFVSSGATQIQFQPWYLFWTLPFVSLIPQLGLILIALALSIGALLRYLPFLYFGDWSQPQTIIFMQLTLILPLVMAIFVILLRKFAKKIT